MRNTILLLDDDTGSRQVIAQFLRTQGYEVSEGESCAAGLAAFEALPPDVAIVDYELGDGNALQLMPRLQALAPDVPILILTGHASIDLAVRAIKEGAEQFLTKPVAMAALQVVVERTIENQRNRLKRMADQTRQARTVIQPFEGTSAAIRHLEEQARRVAGSTKPVLIHGETGSGKGVLAQWLHANSPRSAEALVDLNCAGLSRDFLETELFGHEKGAFTGAVSDKRGLLEMAHRGTVFLDEIGDVDPQVQPKLLKVLEERRFRRLGDVRDRTVDIRLIAASHHDLLALVEANRFRSDLYYRISTIPLVVPPLRQRVEDIPLLAKSFLEASGQELGRGQITLQPDALAALQAYPWPGNIRELRNVLERAALLSDRAALGLRDLHFDTTRVSGQPAPPDESNFTLEEIERRHIERVLRQENGQVPRTAERLGISRSSLYQRIKKYGLDESKNSPR